MNIHLGRVDSFTTEMLVHLVRGNTLVVDLRIVVDEESVCLSCDGLEECGATTGTILDLGGDVGVTDLPARRAEYHQHLSIVYNSVQVLKNINLSRLLATDDLLDPTNDFEENIADTLLVISL